MKRESGGFLVVLTVFKTDVARPRAGRGRFDSYPLRLAALALLSLATLARAAAPPKSRTFDFDYRATLTGLPPGQSARVWFPIPVSNDEQSVATLSPVDGATIATDDRGNTIGYVERRASDAGEIEIAAKYRVTRREATTRPNTASDPRDLQADALVPVGGKPAATLLADRALPSDPIAEAHAFYDLIDDRMEYRKDKPGWGRGDAAWACDSRFGNCTDFHSLFLSLARSSGLPARFEIGFGIPETRGRGVVEGYHCWARFLAGDRGWVPLDISEANKHPEKRDYFFGHLCENRVMFTTGRDLTLVPRQADAPLNFFVYPYAEVDGRAWPADRLRKNFAYADVEK